MTRQEEDKLMKKYAARITKINKELEPYRQENIMKVVDNVLPLVRELVELQSKRNVISRARRKRLEENNGKENR